MRKSMIAKLLLTPSLCALAACGGGGGGGSASGLASTPPPPTPPTSSATLIFPNVTTTTQFATLGYEGSSHPIEIASLVGGGFSVRYDASANNYVMDVPASVPGVFVPVGTTGDRYWNASLTDPATAGAHQPIVLNVFRPGPQNWDFALNYTSFAEYETASGKFGEMAFGQATPASAIPITGSATYAAFAAGQTDFGFAIRGDVALNFNFGAGTLSGSFDPYIYDLLVGNSPLGHYDFVNTVYGVGSATFSGELSRSGIAERGTFNGLFTGPNAQELMARWTAPLPNPSTGTNSQMFGVWVGRCC